MGSVVFALLLHSFCFFASSGLNSQLYSLQDCRFEPLTFSIFGHVEQGILLVASVGYHPGLEFDAVAAITFV